MLPKWDLVDVVLLQRISEELGLKLLFSLLSSAFWLDRPGPRDNKKLYCFRREL